MCSVEGDLLGECKLGVTPSSPHDGLCSLGEVTQPLWAIISELELEEIFQLQKSMVLLFFQFLLCYVSFLGIEFLCFLTFSFNCCNKNFVFMGQKNKSRFLCELYL